MRAVEDVDLLGNGDFIWHAYDPAVKADLFSTGLATSAGTYLIDPIPLEELALAAALGEAQPAGVIITNSNHARAAAAFARKLSVPLYAHADASNGIPDAYISEISAGGGSVAGLEIVVINGAAAGEIALFRPDATGSGTVVIGDAVINSGSYGFTLLPGKYCTNPKLLRQSLRQLLDYTFERIFFAHGLPILLNGRSRLAELLQAPG